MGYPYGPLFQLLVLTACRKNEIGGARWREIDLEKRLLLIPAERFKSDATHLVPLTGAALSVLETLPRFTKGDHLFSSTFGERPVSGFAGAKDRLDKLMVEDLGGALQPFRIHDLRRTVRTRLASLKVPDPSLRWSLDTVVRAFNEFTTNMGTNRRCVRPLSYGPDGCGTSCSPPPENVVSLCARASE